jgi:RNA polymerase sigma factor (sigma-70 family)
MNYAATYLTSALAAAATRTSQNAARFDLSQADREDLYQELILDLLERADRFDPAKGSAGTFTGLVSLNCANDFLARMKKDRERLLFCMDYAAANDPDFGDSAPALDEAAIPLWAQDDDLFTASEVLHDLQQALACLNEAQRALFQLLATYHDLPTACRASGLSAATFYRRVTELRLHLRMFGIRAAA